jgi:hypothetical protein
MEDTITTVPTDIQERLSLAYITAVAAQAGCQITEPQVDRNGIDVTIRPIAGAPVQIDIQLKAVSTNVRINDRTTLSFQLDTPTYDKLRRTDVQAPQLLVVYEMPAERDLWLAVQPTMATLQHAAYWVDLRGRQPVTTASTAVHLPADNLFDHNAIIAILARAHERARDGLSWA